MKTLSVSCLATICSLLWLNVLWLGLLAKGLYRNQIGDLALPSPTFAIAVVVLLGVCHRRACGAAGRQWANL